MSHLRLVGSVQIVYAPLTTDLAFLCRLCNDLVVNQTDPVVAKLPAGCD